MVTIGTRGVFKKVDPTPADGSITTAKLADGAVTTDKLGADAVDSTKLADDAVGAEHIQTGAVGNTELATDAVTNAKIANDAVNTAEIVDGAVTPAKLDRTYIAIPENGQTTTGRWGKISPGSGYGILGGAFKEINVSATLSPYATSTETGIQWVSTGSNTGAGLLAKGALTRRQNFTLTIRWHFNDNGGSNSQNMFIGLTDTPVEDWTSSTTPDNTNCLLFGQQDTNTNWRTMRANGGTLTTSDTETRNTGNNTLVFTGSTSNMTLKFNAQTTRTYTTTIPSTDTGLSIVIWFNAESATTKTFRILDVDLSLTYFTGL